MWPYSPVMFPHQNKLALADKLWWRPLPLSALCDWFTEFNKIIYLFIYFFLLFVSCFLGLSGRPGVFWETGEDILEWKAFPPGGLFLSWLKHTPAHTLCRQQGVSCWLLAYAHMQTCRQQVWVSRWLDFDSFLQNVFSSYFLCLTQQLCLHHSVNKLLLCCSY